MKKNFPDGTPIEEWFYDCHLPKLKDFNRVVDITEQGVHADGKVYTRCIQALIDRLADAGGGVVFVPQGTFYTGALYFKQGVHLYIAQNGVLKGSDDISDYSLCQTRIEGESCLYYPALINADGVDGFTIFGDGTIDGNGFKAWKAFWKRLQWNPAATNKDEQRPRLIYISNSKNITVAGVRIQNSHFWTNHIYKCKRVRFINCDIYAPNSPVRAPSSDAIDIDVCSDVLIKDCRMEVADDAVALKGGKGPFADRDPKNGANERIFVQDCSFIDCHSCLTCGSESVHNKNVLVSGSSLKNVHNLLYVKLRPDTPQHYEYITIENAEGSVKSFLNINPWWQFCDLKDGKEIPRSYVDHITIKNCRCKCERYFDVQPKTEQYRLADFLLEDLHITTKGYVYKEGVIERATVKNVEVVFVGDDKQEEVK